MSRKLDLSAVLWVILMIFAFVMSRQGRNTALAGDNNALINTWALGIDESVGCPGDIYPGWVHSETVTLSRCPKNPAPSGNIEDDGAAFKNGPVNGLGDPSVETSSKQIFNLPVADGYIFEFTALIICVRCDYLEVDLYGDGTYLGSLMRFKDEDPSCEDVEKWPRYCGDPLVVDYYSTYTIDIRTMSGDSLGVKWTGLELNYEPILLTLPTPTSPPPTPTPHLSVYNLAIGETLEIVCPGNLTYLDLDTVYCSESTLMLPRVETGR